MSRKREDSRRGGIVPTKQQLQEKDAAGWWMTCRHCGQWYWVRAADISMPKMRRYTDSDCAKPHECQS